MRRISPARPKEKLRGAKRRVESLKRWVNSTRNYFPQPHKEMLYWNKKIPILDRLVNPPTTSTKIQEECANLLLRAANNIIEAKPKNDSSSIVSVILSLPDMHSSEICVFFDPGYIKQMLYRDARFEKISLLNRTLPDTKLNLLVPSSLTNKGLLFQDLSFDESYEAEWWMFYEKKASQMMDEILKSIPEQSK